MTFEEAFEEMRLHQTKMKDQSFDELLGLIQDLAPEGTNVLSLADPVSGKYGFLLFSNDSEACKEYYMQLHAPVQEKIIHETYESFKTTFENAKELGFATQWCDDPKALQIGFVIMKAMPELHRIGIGRFKSTKHDMTNTSRHIKSIAEKQKAEAEMQMKWLTLSSKIGEINKLLTDIKEEMEPPTLETLLEKKL